MSTVNIFQISLEIWGCIICVIITMISGEKAYKSGGALARTWILLLINGMLLASGSFAYIFRGDVSTMGIYMTRFSNFLVFALEGVMTWNVAACIQCLIQSDKKKVTESRWMRVCSVLIGLQLLGLLITPFTKFYFYFDITNHYHRGDGLFVSFALLGAVCAGSAFRLFRYRKNVPTSILHAIRFALLIFGICFVIQFLVYGISLINIGLTIFLLMMYLVIWNDNNRQESERLMNEVEAMMRELMKERNSLK